MACQIWVLFEEAWGGGAGGGCGGPGGGTTAWLNDGITRLPIDLVPGDKIMPLSDEELLPMEASEIRPRPGVPGVAGVRPPLDGVRGVMRVSP